MSQCASETRIDGLLAMIWSFLKVEGANRLLNISYGEAIVNSLRASCSVELLQKKRYNIIKYNKKSIFVDNFIDPFV